MGQTVDTLSTDEHRGAFHFYVLLQPDERAPQSLETKLRTNKIKDTSTLKTSYNVKLLNLGGIISIYYFNSALRSFNMLSSMSFKYASLISAPSQRSKDRGLYQRVLRWVVRRKSSGHPQPAGLRLQQERPREENRRHPLPGLQVPL